MSTEVFVLNLDRLPAGRSAFALDGELHLPDPFALEGAKDSGSQVRVEGELDVDEMDQKLLVSGTFRVERTAACHRCDRGVELGYDAEIELLVLRHDEREPEGGERSEDDVWIQRQQSGKLELDGPLREAVVLHEPHHILCREDCKGLCSNCGIDRNEKSCDCGGEEIDPRWDALRKLREGD